MGGERRAGKGKWGGGGQGVLMRDVSSIVKVSEFYSKDLRLVPVAEQGERQFLCPSESTLV